MVSISKWYLVQINKKKFIFPDENFHEMKKRLESSKEDRSKNNRKITKNNVSKPVEDKKEETSFEDDADPNQGFATWLRSEDGVEMMRLFVIANSLLVVVTMAWPSMQQTFSIIRDMIMGEDE